MRPSKTFLTGLALLAGLAAAATAQDLTPTERARVDRVRQSEMRQPKIVGGGETDVDEYPWTASIGFVRTNGSIFSYCGGSLIAPEWVLTAAHCQVLVGDKIILGRHDLTTSTGEVIDVAEVITHEDYDSATNDHDICLLHLAQASTQTPIALVAPSEDFSSPGDDFTIAGWGRLQEGGAVSSVLMEVTVPILSNVICQVNYDGTGVQITENMLCAGRTGQDSCQGDSGGPGMVSDTARDVDRLAGIVSFGIGCARPGFPGVYTRVAKFLDWIKDHSGVEPPPEGCDCS